MKANARLTSAIRSFVLAGSLMAALAFGGALANEIATGLIECDHGCMVEVLSGNDDVLAYQDTDVTPFNAYESNEVGEIGFIR